jgi:hypothetical protein
MPARSAGQTTTHIKAPARGDRGKLANRPDVGAIPTSPFRRNARRKSMKSPGRTGERPGRSHYGLRSDRCPPIRPDSLSDSQRKAPARGTGAKLANRPNVGGKTPRHLFQAECSAGVNCRAGRSDRERNGAAKSWGIVTRASQHRLNRALAHGPRRNFTKAPAGVAK